MTLFSLTRKNFEYLGIFLCQSEYPFNKRISIAILSYSLSCALYCLFFFYEAKTFWEYTSSIYSSAITIFIVACFITIIFRIRKIIEFIDNCEKIVYKSESQASKAIYDAANLQIEKWTNIIHLAVAEFTPILCVVPQCIVCFLVYFTTDLGNDAFELSLLMW